MPRCSVLEYGGPGGESCRARFLAEADVWPFFVVVTPPPLNADLGLQHL